MTTAQPTTVVGHRKQIVDGGCAVAGLGHNPRQVQTIHGVGHDGALRREREKEKEKERERAQREHTRRERVVSVHWTVPKSLYAAGHRRLTRFFRGAQNWR